MKLQVPQNGRVCPKWDFKRAKETVPEADKLSSMETDFRVKQADLNFLDNASMCKSHFKGSSTISPKNVSVNDVNSYYVQ